MLKDEKLKKILDCKIMRIDEKDYLKNIGEIK